MVVGRNDELETIVLSLLAHAHSHIAILGHGGIGKTTLALLILHDARVASKFLSRRVFVKCEGLSTASAIIQALANQFLPDISEPRSLQAALLQKLRSGEEPTLVVLDSIESAWATDDLNRVESFLAMLSTLDRISLVITMRGTCSPNGVRWIHLQPLAPLNHADGRSLFWLVCGRPKVEQDPSLDRLLGLVDGLPLAITLMAWNAKSPAYNPARLLKEYDQERTSMLARTPATDRLTSVEISIEISLGLPIVKNNPAAITLLGLLALLPDGVEESDLVMMFPTMRLPTQALRALHQAALCYGDDSGSNRVLAPIRTYMRHHPSYSARGPHLGELRSFYMDLLVEKRRAPTLTAYIKESFASHLNNAQSVLSHALRAGDNGASLLEAIEALAYLSYMTGFGCCISILREAIASSERAHQQLPILAPCKQVLGNMLTTQNELDGAIHALEDAKTIFQVDGRPRNVAQCTQSLGNILRIKRKFGHASELLEQARSIFRGVGDTQGAAQCTKRLADIQRSQRQHRQALQTFKIAMAEFDSVGDPIGVAQCLHGLGAIWLLRRDLSNANKALTRAQQTFATYSNRLEMAQCTQDLADILFLESDYPSATTAFEEAGLIFRELGDSQNAAACGYRLGIALQRQGAQDESAKPFWGAQDIPLRRQEIQDASAEAFQAARAIFKELKDMAGVQNCIRELKRLKGLSASLRMSFPWPGRNNTEQGNIVGIPQSALETMSVPTVHLADCDLCQSEIVGIRYKCLDCLDFDVCQECISWVSSPSLNRELDAE